MNTKPSMMVVSSQDCEVGFLHSHCMIRAEKDANEKPPFELQIENTEEQSAFHLGKKSTEDLARSPR